MNQASRPDNESDRPDASGEDLARVVERNITRNQSQGRARALALDR